MCGCLVVVLVVLAASLGVGTVSWDLLKTFVPEIGRLVLMEMIPVNLPLGTTAILGFMVISSVIMIGILIAALLDPTEEV